MLDCVILLAKRISVMMQRSFYCRVTTRQNSPLNSGFPKIFRVICHERGSDRTKLSPPHNAGGHSLATTC